MNPNFKDMTPSKVQQLANTCREHIQNEVVEKPDADTAEEHIGIIKGQYRMLAFVESLLMREPTDKSQIEETFEPEQGEDHAR